MRIVGAGLFVLGGLLISLVHGEGVTSVAHLTPRGWHVLQVAEGDLNGDGLVDAAVVFTKAAPGAEEYTQSEEDLIAPRRLLVAVRDERNQLRRVMRSDRVVLCRSCGVTVDEPLVHFSILNGALVIEQNILGACEAAYIHQIRFNKNRWHINGELRVRELRTGRQRIIKSGRPTSLATFDISRLNACGTNE